MAEEYRRASQRSVRNRRKSLSEFPNIFSLKIFRQLAISAALLTAVCVLRLFPSANRVITHAFTYTVDTSGITEALSQLLQK